MDEASIQTKMQQVVNLVTTDIASIRTGRASPALIENINVSVYGGQQKLKIQELATISVPDAQTINIDPWDKSIIGEIRQGILAANVGMNPSMDGNIIRISLPPLTTEDREKYTKLLSAKLESGRIMVRQVRADAMHDIKKSFEEKEISEDEKFGQEKAVQGITDDFIEKIDTLGDKKKEELLQL
ncbi:ribosome recycling factor [Candidatus Woesebacteria bacterium RIFCSPLOWO2_01_FULL_39_23]|uniref:Ribosome recycling factor n=1 Tax=Candidatus Woesebacteria bacterium RIFCSPHIGHO2_01_FULL_40_22 TaxID=1802499 RepID=A0A1F7YHX3_9BACT|nr:MAG: ribosome recycling factor [Candidatus Woesebacteria bacterium RBG_16_40_11]OGM26927.1 MAG: ribosome recycling factor [Candidatus Woesebacteria bacterium RIFCSPHIGHO2_01_FULL_40_22]OGM37336.1 MAG: ribosome recycling factor [Candidatus Woesebacteria bacterium RIFCSPHIGHO2_12_FULL_38_9]OGM63201.1 MAG: ribosome recycling factor [Candidatus Woesebacteria bacterium RIFCSPLOWO2_01_FULL_39_23]